ncbi:MAG: Zn-ribbon domain-containing OB-fold protein [Chloroflexi bacterium]|nr:Zn-ribbon domain-containing OB-fold protein [Chloroflexota bacterium]
MPEFPAPVPTQDTEPFWQGCREGKLLLQRCAACGVVRYPPRPMCPQCTSLESRWVPATGTGTVFSYTVTHQALHPSLVGRTPHVIVLVELDEGVRMTSTVLGCTPDQVRIGMPVEVVFHQETDGVILPLFRPAGAERAP